MNYIQIPLSPSQAYQRLKELLSRAEYEPLSEEETNELHSLKEVCSEALSDY